MSNQIPNGEDLIDGAMNHENYVSSVSHQVNSSNESREGSSKNDIHKTEDCYVSQIRKEEGDGPSIDLTSKTTRSFKFNNPEYVSDEDDGSSSSRTRESSTNSLPSVKHLETFSGINYPIIEHQSKHEADDDTGRYCWVCFANDEDDTTAPWVKPCRCRGTTKWVHQVCIQRWIDEKQKGNTTTKVSCPQCNTEYIIFYPPQRLLVVMMDSIDTLISRVCPFVAAGLVVGCIYWTSVTYGAVTVMQVAGHKEGLYLMEQADPLLLLIGLPAIPVALILSKMVKWEDAFLSFIREHAFKIPLLRHILPTKRSPSPVEHGVGGSIPPLSDPISATRILCGALLFPTFSTVLGKILFENVKSNFKRAILGGVAFVTIKGLLRLYHKQQQYNRRFQRKILDHDTTGESISNVNVSQGTQHPAPEPPQPDITQLF